MTQLRYHREDYRLYLAYAQGNLEAGITLFQKSYGSVCKYAYHLTRNSVLNRQDVEDIISQAVAVAFSKSNTFLGESSFYTWMCGIVRYKTLQMYKRKQVLQKRECEWFDMPALCDPLDIIIKKELGQAAMQAYESLPYDLKECIFLVNLSGKTKKETARALRLSKGAFQARHAHAVSTMRKNFMRIYYGGNADYLLL